MNVLPAILSIGTANPPHRYTQEQIYNLAAAHSEFYRSDRIKHIFMNSDIEFRHLDIDLDTFHINESVDELHARYARTAVNVGTMAIQNCLANGQIHPTDIDYIVAVSCTGYLCPGLSSLLIKHLGLRTNIQRADLLGMGCAGAMPGLQRAYDFLKAYPDRKALVLTVEICSACYYIDNSLETVVGNTICADGAAAVVLGMSEDGHLPKIERFETLLDPSLIDAVGFEQREGKLRIVLSKDIRDVAGLLGRKVIDSLLQHSGRAHDEIAHWILHSGGRKVIDSLQKELSLTDDQLRHSKCVLRNFGNMSAPTVLFVLREAMLHGQPKPGDLGVMLAMGPGLALEAALLRW